MDRLDLYFDFAVVGTIRHLTNSEEGRSVNYNELIGKLTELFGNEIRANNALKKAKKWEVVTVDSDNNYSLPNHIKEIFNSPLLSWKRNVLPIIE